MDRLTNYLPPVIYEVNKEIQQITNAELPEIDNLWDNIERVRNNQFITTSDSNRIRLWERLLKIRPDFITQDLDYRKDVVLLRLGLTPPFTYKWLEALLNERVGEENFTIDLDHSKYEIDIRINHKDVNMINELRVFFREVLPANIVTATRRVEIKESNNADVIPTAITKTGNKHKAVIIKRDRTIIQDIDTAITKYVTVSKTLNKHGFKSIERNRVIQEKLKTDLVLSGVVKSVNKHSFIVIPRDKTSLQVEVTPVGLIKTLNTHEFIATERNRVIDKKLKIGTSLTGIVKTINKHKFVYRNREG